jgi:hypothetical protein
LSAITSGRDRFDDIKKRVERTGAINVAFQFYSFAVLFILMALTKLAVPKVLDYCRHDEFPCNRNTLHGIHDVPFSYVFCENIPVSFSQQKTYYMPSVCSFHTVDDALLQWLQVLMVFGSWYKKNAHTAG